MRDWFVFVFAYLFCGCRSVGAAPGEHPPELTFSRSLTPSWRSLPCPALPFSQDG